MNLENTYDLISRNGHPEDTVSEELEAQKAVPEELETQKPSDKSQ